ncbi:hypothetical protein M758_UG204100 [Ceratodon purpureus]|nr:hypothetical protein M758_UG204100 [Ceratodon purpureus]
MGGRCYSEGGGSGVISGATTMVSSQASTRFGTFYSGRKEGELDCSSLFELTKPHVDSYDYFVERGLEEAVRRLQPLELKHPISGATLRLWVEKPNVSPPMKDLGSQALDQRLLPSECRLAGLTYRGIFTADVCMQWNNGVVIRHNISYGKMPVMVKSSVCHLRGLDQRQVVAAKEEATEMGGYFICNGNERIIRLLIMPKRNYVVGVKRSSYKNRGPSYSDKGVMIRCVRPDQSAVTMRMYYMNYGSASLGFSVRRQEFLIPVGIVLKALIETNEFEIYEQLTTIQSESKDTKGAVGSQFVSQRAKIILEEVRHLALFTRFDCLQFLGNRFRPVMGPEDKQQQPATVGEQVLADYILCHLDNPRDKFNLLVFMLQKLFALVDGMAAPDNADALQNHEILLPGHLLTIVVKDRIQDWLLRVHGQLLKEMKEKPAENDLLLKHVQKVLEKVPASDVSKKVEYLLNTGNLVSQSGLDLNQVGGFTLVAEKLNFLRYLSHFRSVHRGAFFATLRTTTVRKLLPESWGFMCPVHTPDGSPCGLLNHLTAACQISSDLDARGNKKDLFQIRRAVTKILVNLGVVPVLPKLSNLSPPEYIAVLLDGCVIGHVSTTIIPSVVEHLRRLKVVDGSEAYMEIKCPGGSECAGPKPTHDEINATAFLSVVASLTPWSDHNQSPRNMYQCQMGKQTMGFPAQALQWRADNKMYRIQTPQMPIAQTGAWTKYHMNQFPTGTNAIVAVLAYTGFDMEDAMILNKSSVERGLHYGQVYKSETIDLTELRQRGDGITNVFARSGALARFKEQADKTANFVDSDGLPYIGQVPEISVLDSEYRGRDVSFVNFSPGFWGFVFTSSDKV